MRILALALVGVFMRPLWAAAETPVAPADGPAPAAAPAPATASPAPAAAAQDSPAPKDAQAATQPAATSTDAPPAKPVATPDQITEVLSRCNVLHVFTLRAFKDTKTGYQQQEARDVAWDELMSQQILREYEQSEQQRLVDMIDRLYAEVYARKDALAKTDLDGVTLQVCTAMSPYQVTAEDATRALDCHNLSGTHQFFAEQRARGTGKKDAIDKLRADIEAAEKAGKLKPEDSADAIAGTQTIIEQVYAIENQPPQEIAHTAYLACMNDPVVEPVATTPQPAAAGANAAP